MDPSNEFTHMGQQLRKPGEPDQMMTPDAAYYQSQLQHQMGLRRPMPNTNHLVYPSDSGNMCMHPGLQHPMESQYHPQFQMNNNAHMYIPQPQFVLSPNAAEFIPQVPNMIAHHLSQPVFEPEPEPEPESDCENHPAVIDLRQTLFTLTINPGKFHARVPSLTENFNKTIDEEIAFEYAIDIIFDQSIMEPNFRYTGARLCDYLQKNLIIKMEKGNFRSYLLSRCDAEFTMQSNQTSRNKDEKQRLQGYVMFMAELFTNMEIEVEGVKRKMNEIGDVLPKLIMMLAYDTKDDINFKCLCQAVKLSGAALEEFEKESTKKTDRMDELFSLINKQIDAKCLKSITNGMLSKVVELRGTDWGKNVPASTSSNDSSDPPTSADGAVFYGPDGLPMSNEEAQFIQNNQSGDESPNTTDNYESESEFTGCGMDDEMYDAYERFLAESGKK